MMEKNNKRKEKQRKVLLIVGMVFVVIWRLYVCCCYHYRYLDDDQAVLWYGTVMFAHGSFPEPCFFGQDYGSMIEALLAVPLYLCRWPLYIALPTVTTMLCLMPFFYYIFAMIRRKNWMQAWGILLFLAGMGWEWDAVTSLPRALIGGFPFAVIGVFLINEEDQKKWKVFMGAILCGAGILITATTVSVVGIGVVYWILRYKKMKGQFVPLMVGSFIGGLMYGGQILFYRVYPEHALYKMDKGTRSWEVFWHNASFLPKRMEEFCFAGRLGVIIIPGLLLFALYRLMRNKKYALLCITGLAVAGSLFMISYYRTMQFYENSILFGQLRTILYMSFLALTIIGLAGIGGIEEKDKRDQKYPILLGIVLAMLFCKLIAFSNAVKDQDSALYNGQLVNIYSVKELEREADELIDLAHSVNANVLVSVSYARFFAYAAKALYYDDPVEFYIPDCDRRVWVYQKMQESGDYRLLLYSLPVSDDMYIQMQDIEMDSPVAYFEREFDVRRGDDIVWGIPIGEL